MIIRTSTDRYLDITYTNAGLLSAHTRCLANYETGDLQIADLFSTSEYADMHFEEMLLQEIQTYALEHGLKTISHIIGPEPFNPTPHLSQQEVEKWYQYQGFEKTIGHLGAVKMVYTMPEL